MTQPEVHVAPLGKLIERLVGSVMREADAAYEKRQRFAMAIPGGSVVPALKGVPLDWQRSHVFWVDERAVSPASHDSNFGVARRQWLEPAKAAPASVHRMPADDPDLTAAAIAYGHEIVRVLGPAPQLDVVLLGVGQDGHVASLFPGHPALSETHDLVLPIVDAPKLPPRRLTLTLPLLTGAGRVIVMALGDSKAPVMQEAIERADSSLPVSLVLRSAHRALVLLDEDAGSRL
jgi:6-phosphogluconolactonase